MSHLRCPLCGKNAPLSSFDPSSLDLDLRLVSFRGLGRGRGFEVSDEYSVLGDDDLSPQVAERVLALCKMFLDNGVIDSEQTKRKLELDSMIKTSSELPKITQSLVPPIRSASNGAEIAQAREIIEQQRKELALERMIGRELVQFVKYYPYVEINEDELPWSIEITDIDYECLPVLVNLFSKFNYDEQKTLLKRLSTIHPVVQTFIKELTRREKTISERMLEIDPPFVLELSNYSIQESISERLKASDPTAQKTLEKPNKKQEKTISEKLLELDLS